MVTSCCICPVSLSLSAFISVRTPSMSIANLGTDWAAELMLSSMDRCFEIKFSRSWSISASRCLTVDRLEISPELSLTDHLVVEFDYW
jgi:hypothetical protein